MPYAKSFDENYKILHKQILTYYMCYNTHVLSLLSENMKIIKLLKTNS